MNLLLNKLGDTNIRLNHWNVMCLPVGEYYIFYRLTCNASFRRPGGPGSRDIPPVCNRKCRVPIRT